MKADAPPSLAMEFIPLYLIKLGFTATVNQPVVDILSGRGLDSEELVSVSRMNGLAKFNMLGKARIGAEVRAVFRVWNASSHSLVRVNSRVFSVRRVNGNAIRLCDGMKAL